MPNIAEESLQKHQAFMNGLNQEFDLWRPHLQELAQFILPRAYPWIQQTRAAGVGATEVSSSTVINQTTAANVRQNKILDGAGTEAARTLAHGLMAGVTSPARPWFRLRLKNFPDTDEGYPIVVQRWLDDTTQRLLTIMGESNFYNAIGLQYSDLTVFGSSLLLIYEDFEEVIRVYHSPVGEFRLFQDDRRMVSGAARAFEFKVHQIVDRFGLANCSDAVKTAYRNGGASLLQSTAISHLILPNKPQDPIIKGPFEFVELYWETGKTAGGNLLGLSGFREKAHIGARWDLMGNDTYGSSPAMDALGDIKQLQHAVKEKGQSLDKMNRPPLVADINLKNSPTALLPGGISYLPSASTVGAKPIYTVNPPLGEMANDREMLKDSIRRHFYNNLFRNVSNLSTVRSAAEIYERKSEDMVILGAILERFENEALTPAINRIYKIAERKGLLLDPPPELDDEVLEIQYVSMLADAQRNIGSAATERAWQALGNIGALKPDVLDILDWDESVRHYFSQVGVPAKTVRPRAETQEEREGRAEQLEAQQAALTGRDLTSAAQNLSQTTLGAGSALDQLTGG